MRFMRRHREMFAVALAGLLIMMAFNVIMVCGAPDVWTNTKVGFWSAFYKRFVYSGFDPYTYIIISKWRPLYVIARHPLLSVMVWPLSQLNSWLMSEFHVNCAIYIVAVVWTLLGLCSWMLMYRILRRIIEMTWQQSFLLTAFFFSFSHVMLTIFVEDHMSITLPLLLLAVYLAGKAMKKGRGMALWQSLLLAFVATGVTTTNIVKIGIADLFTQWRGWNVARLIRHFVAYVLPLGIILGLFLYQQDTTQAEETRNNSRQMERKAARDAKFAKEYMREKESIKKRRQEQLIHSSLVTSTEYHIDRWPSLQENIFGEGIMLHEEHLLQDGNKDRPALVRYSQWWYYLIEIVYVALFFAGIWWGRRERLVWMTVSMFLFDMLLHVGLNFASADAYIMTAHWAFAIPVAVAYLMKNVEHSKWGSMLVTSTVIFLTLFLWIHNAKLIVGYIL